MMVCLFFVHSMASKSYESGFKRYYGNRLDNISNETTEEDIKRIYDDWAGEYEEVILISIHGTILGDPGAASREDAIFSGESLLQKRERASLALKVNFARKYRILPTSA